MQILAKMVFRNRQMSQPITAIALLTLLSDRFRAKSTAKLFAIVPLLFILSACGDSCSTYSKYSCSQIEKASYNVFFYFPDGREYYLGSVEGLGNCSALAGNYSVATKAPKYWVCCMKTAKSSCEEKHR